MAIARAQPTSGLLTYEGYMSEPVVMERNDIIDGARVYMAGPTWDHQRIQFRAQRAFSEFETSSQIGFALGAPFDVLLSRHPLRTRQPDVLFITKEQMERGGGIPKSGPIEVGPELVVEIISDSERAGMLRDRLLDFCAVGVKEAWVVRPKNRTIEVLELSPEGYRSIAIYSEGDRVRSITFPNLSVSVDEILVA